MRECCAQGGNKKGMKHAKRVRGSSESTSKGIGAAQSQAWHSGLLSLDASALQKEACTGLRLGHSTLGEL